MECKCCGAEMARSLATTESPQPKDFCPVCEHLDPTSKHQLRLLNRIYGLLEDLLIDQQKQRYKQPGD